MGNITRTRSVSTVLTSTPSSNLRLIPSSSSLQHYVLTLTSMVIGDPIPSHTHTHPSHSQTPHLLSTFLSLGIHFLVTQPSVCESFTSMFTNLRGLVSHYTDPPNLYIPPNSRFIQFNKHLCLYDTPNSFTHSNSPIQLTNLLSPIHFPFIRYSLPPVYLSCYSL
jgi:hypothetical protein